MAEITVAQAIEMYLSQPYLAVELARMAGMTRQGLQQQVGWPPVHASYLAREKVHVYERWSRNGPKEIRRKLKGRQVPGVDDVEKVLEAPWPKRESLVKIYHVIDGKPLIEPLSP